MLGRTHALSGADAVLALTPLLRDHGVTVDAWAVPVAAVTAAGAAVLPDFDHADATPARSLGPLTAGLAWCVGLVSGGHRNGTHSFLGLAQGCPLFWPVHDHATTTGRSARTTPSSATSSGPRSPSPLPGSS